MFRYIVRHDVRGYADHLLPRLHAVPGRQDAAESPLLLEIADPHRRMALCGGAHQYLLSDAYVEIALWHMGGRTAAWRPSKH
ncbi:hypothetical protein DKT74_13520 [Streptomyces sp. ZEA17I]|uniref:hypothetical protein n=1 Tax=Streptomyces sp. ZEA17I TaxID=2202516 RepID=UPI000D7002BD|nr:hypothetical protein [Streptomyces sp. ZEA17I]PWS44001.1 hypothetical protein DKT74_13520 [Streptomyces sp. ZEA17I]